MGGDTMGPSQVSALQNSKVAGVSARWCSTALVYHDHITSHCYSQVTDRTIDSIPLKNVVTVTTVVIT